MFYQPLYGYLREKLQVATRLYFEEKDFSQTGILEVLDIRTDATVLETNGESFVLTSFPVITNNSVSFNSKLYCVGFQELYRNLNMTVSPSLISEESLLFIGEFFMVLY